MPSEIGPRRVQLAAHAGFKRMRNFRSARLMFIRSFVGPYYDKDHGNVGAEPLNLIFNAIRVLVPNLVSNFPKHNVATEFLAYREYANLLGLALDFNSKQIEIVETYRRWIVDALFTMGILKTGIADSGKAINFGDNFIIDPGEIYTANVDFDNFTFDPTIRGDLREAAFMGDRIIVPRREVLESGLYNNALVEQLPNVHARPESGRGRSVSDLSRSNIGTDAFLEQEIELLELWVPAANAIVTVPGASNVFFEDYLRVDDHDGDSTGPYTFLSFTPPVPNNPLPIAMVGIWQDLHTMANKMAVKIMDQASRQKDITVYKPSAADDAVELRDASDGDAVAVEDPDGVRVMSYGGQARSNEGHVIMLQSWFNMMAANPQGIGGQDLRADSATEANILNQNANIGLSDMNDLIYIAGAKEARKRAFLMHTDPLINIPLVTREPLQLAGGTQMQEVQVFLTPEARRGDFFDFAFEFQQDSMKKVDHTVRLQRAFDFGVRILPTAVNAAVMASQVGIPFNLPVYLRKMAEAAGIDWLDEVFFDPNFQQRIQFILANSPQFQNSGGQLSKPGSNVNLGILQNGQDPQAGAAPKSADAQFRGSAQVGAADGQRAIRGFMSSGNA